MISEGMVGRPAIIMTVNILIAWSELAVIIDCFDKLVMCHPQPHKLAAFKIIMYK